MLSRHQSSSSGYGQLHFLYQQYSIVVNKNVNNIAKSCSLGDATTKMIVHINNCNFKGAKGSKSLTADIGIFANDNDLNIAKVNAAWQQDRNNASVNVPLDNSSSTWVKIVDSLRIMRQCCKHEGQGQFLQTLYACNLWL